MSNNPAHHYDEDGICEACGQDRECRPAEVRTAMNNPTTGEFKYDPTLEVPKEIMAAAYKISKWATLRGWKHWEIGPVADRAALAAAYEKGRQHNDVAIAQPLRQQLATEREKYAKWDNNLKCPTCGYQLVILENDELVKLTEKAAYHELRQQLAAAVVAIKTMQGAAMDENLTEVQQIGDAALAKI